MDNANQKQPAASGTSLNEKLASTFTGVGQRNTAAEPAAPAGDVKAGDAQQPTTTTAAPAATEKPAAQPGKAGDLPAGPISAADVQKMIADAITQDRTQRGTENTRERFIRDKMSDLPLSVQGLMPASADPAELAKAEQGLRAELRAWAAKSGFKVPDVGGNSNTGGTTPINTILKPTGSPTQRLADAMAAKSPD